MNELSVGAHERIEVDVYPDETIPADAPVPLEWPDTTRLEVRGAEGISLWWRDDAQAVGEGRWWFTGTPRFALTWFELYEAYGQHLVDATPLYPPAAAPVAVRPVQVLLSRNPSGTMHAWCFTDGDDARAAYDMGVGEFIVPSVLLAPGVALEAVHFLAGWARVGRNPADDIAPHIQRSMSSWAAPGAVVSLQRSGDDLDGLATAGLDVMDLWCIGLDADAVLDDLGQRFAECQLRRAAVAAWHPSPVELLM